MGRRRTATTRRRPTERSVAVALVTAAVLGAALLAVPVTPAGAALAPQPPRVPIHTITNIDRPGMGAPTAIVRATTGDLWFLDHKAIGRVTPAGVVSLFRDPGIVEPRALVAAADGNVWFANARDTVGRVTPDGSVTVFDFSTEFGTRFTGSAVASTDGLLWFGLKGGPDGIGSGVLRITTAGTRAPLEDRVGGGSEWFETPLAAGADGSVWYAQYTGSVRRYRNGVDEQIIGGMPEHPGASVDPVHMVVAADGDLWFTSGDGIGRLTPAGVVTSFTDPALHDAGEIIFGPDGALWFTNGKAEIGRMTTSGAVTVFADAAIGDLAGMTLGPDGALWFTDTASSSVGRLTTSGVVTTFTERGLNDPGEIIRGPDAAMWFVNGASSIGRVDSQGSVTAYSDRSIASPMGFEIGSDGALWFTNTLGSSSTRRGRIAMDGSVTSFPADVVTPPGPAFVYTPWLYETVHGSAVGPDGNLWMTATTAYQKGYPPIFFRSAAIVRATAAGERTVFPLPVYDDPGAIVAGADGAMWFADGDRIGRVTMAGGITMFPLGRCCAIPTVAAGPDGAVWFTDRDHDAIGRISTQGVVTRFTDPSVRAPSGLAAGSDGAMWFTNRGTGTIGRISTTVSAAFHPLAPARLLDSRTAAGGWNAPLTAGAPRTLEVAGGIVPATASAVVLNVTATASTAGSFVSVWPAGEPPPNASTVNFAAGQTVANLTTVAVGANGGVTFGNNAGAVHVIADVVGYYDDGSAAGDLYQPATPTRVFDSRQSAILEAGHPIDVSIDLAGLPVPDTVTAIVANVTVTDSNTGSYLTAWGSGDPPPVTSNLNFGAGQTIANLTVVRVGDGGRVRLATAAGSTHVVVDVVGWFDAASGLRFHATSPQRVLDDRVGHGAPGPWSAGLTRQVRSAGAPMLAAGAQAQVLNVTVTNGSSGSFLGVTAADQGSSATSTINFGPGETIANLTITAVEPHGNVAIRNHLGTVDVVADSLGYFAAN